MNKTRIDMRFDTKLLHAIDNFIKKLIPKKNRTQFMEEAAKNELRKEKQKLWRENNQ